MYRCAVFIKIHCLAKILIIILSWLNPEALLSIPVNDSWLSVTTNHVAKFHQWWLCCAIDLKFNRKWVSCKFSQVEVECNIFSASPHELDERIGELLVPLVRAERLWRDGVNHQVRKAVTTECQCCLFCPRIDLNSIELLYENQLGYRAEKL